MFSLVTTINSAILTFPYNRALFSGKWNMSPRDISRHFSHSLCTGMWTYLAALNWAMFNTETILTIQSKHFCSFTQCDVGNNDDDHTEMNSKHCTSRLPNKSKEISCTTLTFPGETSNFQPNLLLLVMYSSAITMMTTTATARKRSKLVARYHWRKRHMQWNDNAPRSKKDKNSNDTVDGNHSMC